jgi:hypothetical protein
MIINFIVHVHQVASTLLIPNMAASSWSRLRGFVGERAAGRRRGVILAPSISWNGNATQDLVWLPGIDPESS